MPSHAYCLRRMTLVPRMAGAWKSAMVIAISASTSPASIGATQHPGYSRSAGANRLIPSLLCLSAYHL
jgi:hypothetical protein